MSTVVSTSTYELERGKPKPSKNHGIIQLLVGHQLLSNYKDVFTFGSEIHLQSETDILVPDISIFPKSVHFDPNEDELRVETAPRGIIEILSPRQSLNDLLSKAGKYFAMGVESYWLIIPGLRNVYVFDAPDSYEIYRHTQTLKDGKLNIEMNLEEIFG